jgi:hypothetical protein
MRDIWPTRVGIQHPHRRQPSSSIFSCVAHRGARVSRVMSKIYRIRVRIEEERTASCETISVVT